MYKKNWQEMFGLGSLLPGRKIFYQGLLPAKDSSTWNVFRGCGHSFHIEFILTNISDCPVNVKQQRWQMLKLLEGLGKTANFNAVYSGDSL
jgi:hypothetical protein